MMMVVLGSVDCGCVTEEQDADGDMIFTQGTRPAK